MLKYKKIRLLAASTRDWPAIGLALMVLALGACSEAPNVSAAATGAVRTSAPVSAAPPSPPTLSGNYLAAIHARARNDSLAAAKFMGEVLKADPKNTTIVQAAFMLKLQDGKITDAVPLAKQLQNQHPAHHFAAVTLIADALKAGDFAGAKNRAIRLEQQGLGVLLRPLLCAWADAGLGDVDAAQAQLAPLENNKSFFPFYAYHSALIYSLGGRAAEAEQKFKLLMGDPGGRSARAAQAYGQFLETQNKYAEAAELYRSTQPLLQPLPLLAAAEARNQAHTPGQLLITKAADGAAEALYGIGGVLGQDDNSGPLPIVYLRLAAHIRPDFEEAIILLAGRLESLQRNEDAIAIYEKIPVNSPLHESARIQIALNQDQLERTSDAIATLQRYTQAHPQSRNALLALADLLRGNEQFKDAVPVYDKVIPQTGGIKPYHWPLLYARGISHERAGNWPPAERDLLRALELEPDQPNVLNYLAYSWIDKGVNLERAKSMIEKAASLRPEDGAIIDSLGWMHYRTGNYQRAVETLENAISLMPQDAVINDHLGDAYWQVGRKLEAQFQWRRALIFEPAPDIKHGIELKLEKGLSGARQPLAVRF